MNEDAAYTIFFGFGLVWVAMGVAAVIALLKLDNQSLKLGKWGLVVAIPIIVPFIAALVIAAMMS